MLECCSGQEGLCLLHGWLWLLESLGRMLPNLFLVGLPQAKGGSHQRQKMCSLPAQEALLWFSVCSSGRLRARWTHPARLLLSLGVMVVLAVAAAAAGTVWGLLLAPAVMGRGRFIGLGLFLQESLKHLLVRAFFPEVILKDLQLHRVGERKETRWVEGSS